MNTEQEKCVMVINEDLPIGAAVNTAAILGVTLGRLRPDVVGVDVVDLEGHIHPGIIQFPIPVLRGSPKELRALRQKLYEPKFQELAAVDFSDLAQGCRGYQEFIEKMAACPESNLQYIGIALCGTRKKVNTLTGSLPLLR